MTVNNVTVRTSDGPGAATDVRRHGSAGVRERILAAARAEAAVDGGFSLKAVAARAGVSRQTIHYHFGGTRGLRAALAAEGLAEPQSDEPTRERLIDAAQRLLSRPGGSLTSIEAIAAEAGLTKGAVYHHFADRTELIRAVAHRVSPVDEMLAVIDTSREIPLREGLVAITAGYYAAMGSRADFVRNLAANASRDPDLSEIVMGEIVGRGAPLILGWLGEKRDRGELAPVDPSFIIQALFGPAFLAIVLGPATFERFEALGVRPAVRNVEAYVDFILAGIGEAAPPPADPSAAAVSNPSEVTR